LPGSSPKTARRANVQSHPLLVVISGPSGVGKDALLDVLRSRGRPYHFAITATTRPRRGAEKDSRDYYFVSPDRFEEMAATGELLEHAIVYGHRYGVPKGPIRQALADGRDVLMRTDVQGVATIKGAIPQAVTIFLAPASLADLEERLRRRATDSPETVRLRLDTARREMDAAGHFDHIVVNAEGRLQEAADQVERIIAAERARPEREAPVV
jgi:guanylate kinase